MQLGDGAVVLFHWNNEERYSLLIVDEIGYLPVGSGGGNLFFQLFNACYG